MNNTFKIDSKLLIRFKLNNSFAFDSFNILVKLGYDNSEFYTDVAPIIIDSSFKIKYDPNYEDIDRIKQYDFNEYANNNNRSITKFIYDTKVQDIIKNIKEEIKSFIKDNKSNLILSMDDTNLL